MLFSSLLVDFQQFGNFFPPVPAPPLSSITARQIDNIFFPPLPPLFLSQYNTTLNVKSVILETW